MKKIGIVPAALATALLLSACGRPDTANGATASEGVLNGDGATDNLGDANAFAPSDTLSGNTADGNAASFPANGS